MKKKINWKKILEWVKIGADTVTALTPVIRMILVASGVFVVTMLIGDFKNKTLLDNYASASKQHQKETEKALQQVETYKAQVIQLQTAAAAIESDNKRLAQTIVAAKQSVKQDKSTAVVLVQSLDTTKTQRDSIKTLVQIIPVKDSIIKKQDVVILQQDSTINNLNILVDNKNKQIDKLQISVTTLEAIVSTTPKYDACEQKFFFCKINKPSRKTSLMVGFGVGVLTTGILLR